MSGTLYIPNEVTTLDEIRQIRDAILASLQNNVQLVTDSVLNSLNFDPGAFSEQIILQVLDQLGNTGDGLKLNTDLEGVFVNDDGINPFAQSGQIYTFISICVLETDDAAGIYKIEASIYNDDGELVALDEPTISLLGGVDVYAQGVYLDIDAGLRAFGATGKMSGIMLQVEMPVERVLPPLPLPESSYY